MAEKIAIPSRSELVRRYERDYLLRNPGAKVGERQLPGIDARVCADQLLPLYAEASRLGGTPDLDNLVGTDLEAEAEDLGLEGRLPAAGASGAVIAETSIGGATILTGTQCRNKATGYRYACTVTAVYQNGDQVPVEAVDLGPLTDVEAGAVLEWSSPPPGLATRCVVAEQIDGSGLSGGRSEETDEEIRTRIRTERRAPALAGNAADYRRAAAETPNLAIQAVFAFPAILGPGTVGLAFTMRPAQPGGDRRPNGTQIALVRAHVIGQMPEDDGLFMYALLDDPVDLSLKVRWRRGTAFWTDNDPWPVYAPLPYEVAAATDALHFSMGTGTVSPKQPQVGQSIAFWDKVNSRFVRKRIKSFTGDGGVMTPWVITCDTANGASDTSFVPAVGDVPGPWSDALADIAEPLLQQFDPLGPSDHTSFDTGGLRRRRIPFGFEAYPNELSGRILIPLYSLSAIDDIQVAAPSLPRAAPPGTLGSTAYLTSLRSVRVFAL